ncbi:STAS domain-containing protein [Sorangium sp. So ce726]|uniref:STAS domain-containing protein n=1 Tax=Sorangium sp. So ce726 TaxID=3133319 RepID=UPI003F5E02C7
MTPSEESDRALRAEIERLRGRVAELTKAEAELALLREEQAALRASEAELVAMFHAMNDVVLVMSDAGKYLKIAPTAPSLLFRPSEELLGKTVHDIMPAEFADFIVSKIREALASGHVVSCEYSLPIRDAELLFSARISPMPDGRVVFIARDETERKTAQKRLEETQHKIIQAQEAALAELSMPLIPISDQIVVMPLIGKLDARRMDLALQCLLTGIQSGHVQVAIVDVTGVSVIDRQVADALVRLARAAQLLGAQVVLTGIQPGVARTLCEIGAELTGIITLGTLQSGIAYAWG